MKKLIRSQFILAFAAAVGLLLASCSGKQNNLVGKWKTSEGGSEATVTFTKDGKVIDEEGGKPQNGEYSLSTSNTVTMKIPNPDTGNGGGKDNVSIEFAIVFASADEMTLTPKSMGGVPVPGGNAPSAKFTRVSK